MTRGERLLREHVVRFNAGVASGDFDAMLAAFTDDAVLAFEGAPVDPLAGRDAIAAAYRERPPDDEIELLDVSESTDGVVRGLYAWASDPSVEAGELRLTPSGSRIARLVVTFANA